MYKQTNVAKLYYRSLIQAYRLQVRLTVCVCVSKARKEKSIYRQRGNGSGSIALPIVTLIRRSSACCKICHSKRDCTSYTCQRATQITTADPQVCVFAASLSILYMSVCAIRSRSKSNYRYIRLEITAAYIITHQNSLSVSRELNCACTDILDDNTNIIHCISEFHLYI